MVESLAVTDRIKSLRDIREKFALEITHDSDFFPEWYAELPELTESEQLTLERLKRRYWYYADDNAITEGTINIIMISPLLELLSWCDPPFKLKAEKSVAVEIDDSETPLKGFIDGLVVQNQFWVVVIEAKRYGFNVSLAIPQTLAYMMAKPET
ncbi:MAG: hypothetical protein WA865_16485, partial [Spirulinaceae cyanobacterium]